MTCVHPEDVAALKRRLGPAFDALAARAPIDFERFDRGSSDQYELVDAWRAYESAPVDWLDAHLELERGKDLEARLAWMQGPRTRRPGRANTGPHAVGETFGMHTVAELRDLLAAKQKERDEVNKAGSLARPEWQAADAAAFAAWSRDLAAANDEFERARSDAQGVIDFVPGILDEAPLVTPPGQTKSVWDSVIEASKPYLGLTLRLTQAGHAPAPYTVPQPTAPDRDLQVYKAADRGVQGIESVGRQTGGVVAALAAVVGVALFVKIVRK